MYVWIAVLIAILPAFVLFLYVARSRKSLWLIFALGAVGWTGALLARLPILNSIPSIIDSRILIFALASLLAGIFEEGVRYGLLYGVNKIKSLKIDWRIILSFGLGWGFFEAVLIYSVNMLILVYIIGQIVPFLDMLPGAVERNSAVIFHAALTFIVYKAVVSKIRGKIILIALAILLHAIVDFFVLMLLYTVGLPVWNIEVTVLAISILVALLAYVLVKKEFTLKPIDGQ